jgi:hypothetical protein
LANWRSSSYMDSGMRKEMVFVGGLRLGMTVRSTFLQSTYSEESWKALNVLYSQGLKRFLLAIIDVEYDRFSTDLSSSINVISFCPQCRILAPILATENLKFLHQSVRSNPFEQTDDFGRRVFGMHSNQQMYMLWQDCDCQDFQPVWFCDFRQPCIKPGFDRANQDFYAIARISFSAHIG